MRRRKRHATAFKNQDKWSYLKEEDGEEGGEAASPRISPEGDSGRKGI